MRKPKHTMAEKRAKYWIAKHLGLQINGLDDKAMCRMICEQTKWPEPTKSQRKPLMARYWREVLQGKPPPDIPYFVSPPRVRRQKPDKAIRRVLRKDFYVSDEWRSIRYEALKLHGARCQCCGMSPKEGKIMHVDHIKPRSKYPELALDVTNLQVLCEDCNLGKMARDETDWRPADADPYPEGAMEHMRSIN